MRPPDQQDLHDRAFIYRRNHGLLYMYANSKRAAARTCCT